MGVNWEFMYISNPWGSVLLENWYISNSPIEELPSSFLLDHALKSWLAWYGMTNLIYSLDRENPRLFPAIDSFVLLLD